MTFTTTRIKVYGGCLARHALSASGAILVSKSLALSRETGMADGVLTLRILGLFLYALGVAWSLLLERGRLQCSIKKYQERENG